MKKLLGVLAASLAVLVGLLGYAYVTDTRIPGEEYVEELFRSDDIDSFQDEFALENQPESTEAMPESIPITSNNKLGDAVNDEMIVMEEEVDADDAIDEEKVIDIESNTHDANSYAYSKLSEAERGLYDLLYSAAVNYEENVDVPTTDKDVLEKVFNCVMMDHPEIFYVNGYRYTKYTSDDVIKRMTFSASYCYGQGEKNSIEQELIRAEDNILANVYTGASDYDKIKYIYEYIINTTEYDLNSPDNQNIISVLLNGRSVCQGYAKAFQILLNKLGIPCTLVTGLVSTGERHAWNMVMADGDWYYVDVTWGDASYQTLDGNNEGYIPTVNYDFLLVPSAEIDLNHKSASPVSLPYTQASADNYYVKEGLYLTTYDPDQLKAIFDYRKSLGEPMVALKCSDSVLYNQLHNELLGNKKIFDYLKSDKIRYETDDSLHKLVFALQ